MHGFGREVRKLLKQAGWSKLLPGKGSHEMWGSVNGANQSVSVPKKIKSPHTANKIMKLAGLGKKF